MTTIAAVRTGGTIVMAADHLVTTEQRMPFVRFPKIVRLGHLVTGDWLVGMAGPVSILQAASRALSKTLHSATSIETLEDVLRDVHVALTERAGLRPHHEAGPVEEMHFQMLLAGPLGLFLCTEDRALLEISVGDYWAIGSGAKYALGALAMKADQAPGAPERAKRAVLAAARFDLHTGLDVTVETVPVPH